MYKPGWVRYYSHMNAQSIRPGDTLDPARTPRGKSAPFTVLEVGRQAEGPFYTGTWSDGSWGVVLHEEIEDED